MKSFVFLACLFPMIAFACAAERVSFSKGYARETAPGQPVAAVYIQIENKGDEVATIKKITSPAAGEVMVHQNHHHAHSVKMVALETLDIPAHGTVTLKPGEDSMHIMLMDLKKPLHAGDTLTLHITYEDGSLSEVQDIPVKSE